MSELREKILQAVLDYRGNSQKTTEVILALVDAERPSGLVATKECEQCDGSGQSNVSTAKCNWCGGTGIITRELSGDEAVELLKWHIKLADGWYESPSGEKVSLKS